MPPDNDPMTQTLSFLPLYLSSVYLTMLTMPSVSPPCPCVSDAGFCTSQQLLWFGVPGKIRMKPFWSAYDGSRVLRSHCSPELPQEWSYVW